MLDDSEINIKGQVNHGNVKDKAVETYQWLDLLMS